MLCGNVKAVNEDDHSAEKKKKQSGVHCEPRACNLESEQRFFPLSVRETPTKTSYKHSLRPKAITASINSEAAGAFST